MDISGISARDPVSLAPTAGSPEVDKDAFMKLLVTQLQNQDPMNPTANEDFIAQLATFSSLEELEQMNGNLSAMMTLNRTNALLSQLTESSALIGKMVSWADPKTGDSGHGSVDSVRVENGIALLQIGDMEVPLGAVTEIFGSDMDMLSMDEEMNGEMGDDEMESEA
jgi:flagellar basal-body rod modification protein FlgD